MPAPTLNIGEYQLGDSGTLLNGDATIPFVDITRVEGLDHPEFKLQDHDKAGDHGTFANALHLKQREITLEGTAYAASLTALSDYLDLLKIEYAPSDVLIPFYYRLGSSVRKVFVLPIGLRYDLSPDNGPAAADVQFNLYAGDPRIYQADFVTSQVTKTTTLDVTVDVENPSPLPCACYIDITPITPGAQFNPPDIDASPGSKYIHMVIPSTKPKQIIHDGPNKSSRMLQGTSWVSARPYWEIDSDWIIIEPGTNTLTISEGLTATNILVKVTPWVFWW